MLLSRRLPIWLMFGVTAIAVSLFLTGAGICAKAKSPLIDLNTASPQELESLKGIGPATAKKIIEARPYTSVADLTKAGLTAKQYRGPKTSGDGQAGQRNRSPGGRSPGKAG